MSLSRDFTVAANFAGVHPLYELIAGHCIMLLHMSVTPLAVTIRADKTMR